MIKNLSAADVVPPRPLTSAASVRKQADVYRLRVVSRLPADRVCESLLFGNVRMADMLVAVVGVVT